MDLVEQHPQRYSAHVEPVKEVLDVVFHDMIDPFNVLQFENAMRHSFYAKENYQTFITSHSVHQNLLRRVNSGVF